MNKKKIKDLKFYIILLSSVVEPSAVNRVVVGSNPTGGAREPPIDGGFVIPSNRQTYPKVKNLL